MYSSTNYYSNDQQAGYCSAVLSQYDPQVLDAFKKEMSTGVERFFFLSYCLLCCWPCNDAKRDFHLQSQWSTLEFNVNTQEPMSLSYFDMNYKPGASVPIDVDYDYKRGRTFITIPRFDEGRPIVLGTVDANNQIVPYPDYSWHENPRGPNGCEGMISVFRVAIDECDRLWVMDTGKIGETEICPPKLLAFDLADDRLIYKHVVEDNGKEADSLMITPVVDIRSRSPGDCEDTFVFVADVTGFAILVVDVRNNKSWRLKHRLFYPYPQHGEFTIEGESFQLMDGVLGMALSPYKQGFDRFLFSHSLAAVTENVVSADALRNQSYQLDDKRGLTSIPIHLFKRERPNQAVAEAIDKDGIMYFGIMEPPSIWCWNIATEFAQKNFHQVAVDREALQFASGLKVITDEKGNQELLVITVSFQRVMTGSINGDRTNFRIFRGAISKLLAHSRCKNSRPLG